MTGVNVHAVPFPNRRNHLQAKVIYRTQRTCPQHIEPVRAQGVLLRALGLTLNPTGAAYAASGAWRP